MGGAMYYSPGKRRNLMTGLEDTADLVLNYLSDEWLSRCLKVLDLVRSLHKKN
jgi:hypothetical protein